MVSTQICIVILFCLLCRFNTVFVSYNFEHDVINNLKDKIGLKKKGNKKIFSPKQQKESGGDKVAVKTN